MSSTILVYPKSAGNLACVQMRALVLSSEERTARVTHIPEPELSGSEVLIRVHAVALNPVDSLYVFRPIGSTGRVVGSDFAGTVHKTYNNATYSSTSASSVTLQVGDRVAGFVQGASSVNDRPGAFAEYVAVPQDLLWKVPDSMSFADAATISLCSLTAAQALFSGDRLGLRPPWEFIDAQSAKQEAQFVVFVYGASTSVGLLAAQLLRHCGSRRKLIGCTSPKHFERLRKLPYSYDALIDHRSDWQNQLSKVTEATGIDLAYDCISEGETVRIISKLLKPAGKMAIVRSAEGGAWTSNEPLPVVPSYGAVWEGLGETVQYQGLNLPANPEARGFATRFYSWLSEHGHQALQPLDVRMMPGGLDKIVEDGFQLLGSGFMVDRVVNRKEEWMRPVSAEKLVYHIRGCEV